MSGGPGDRGASDGAAELMLLRSVQRRRFVRNGGDVYGKQNRGNTVFHAYL